MNQMNQIVEKALADARTSRPTKKATNGSIWWVEFDATGFIGWSEIPRGREPFETMSFSVGSRVIPGDVGDEFEAAVLGLWLMRPREGKAIAREAANASS